MISNGSRRQGHACQKQIKHTALAAASKALHRQKTQQVEDRMLRTGTKVAGQTARVSGRTVLITMAAALASRPASRMAMGAVAPGYPSSLSNA